MVMVIGISKRAGPKIKDIKGEYNLLNMFIVGWGYCVYINSLHAVYHPGSKEQALDYKLAIQCYM